MKALAEQARGERGVWTQELEAREAAARRLAEERARQREANAKFMKGCAVVFGAFMAFSLVVTIIATAAQSCIDAAGSAGKRAPTKQPVRKR